MCKVNTCCWFWTLHCGCLFFGWFLFLYGCFKLIMVATIPRISLFSIMIALDILFIFVMSLLLLRGVYARNLRFIKVWIYLFPIALFFDWAGAMVVVKENYNMTKSWNSLLRATSLQAIISTTILLLVFTYSSFVVCNFYDEALYSRNASASEWTGRGSHIEETFV